MSKKCDICDNREYEESWLDDYYKEILRKRSEHLNPNLREKLENFVKEKRPCIYVCHDCKMETVGKNRIKD